MESVNGKKVLKVSGIVGIIAGCVALYFGGGDVESASSIVGLAFSAIGIIVAAIGVKK